MPLRRYDVAVTNDLLPPNSSVNSETARRVHAVVSSVLAEHAGTLVNRFYEVFLNDPKASRYLTHKEVQDRLSLSLRNWLLSLFEFCPPRIDREAQRKIGEVHARLGIPIDLVLKGASLLKNGLSRKLMERIQDASELGEALIMIDDAIDHAMSDMSGVYVTGTKTRARAAEAYRLFSLGQDIAVEREVQRVALMEWSQSVLLGMLASNRDLPPLSQSVFGLWLRHRAVVLFEGASELERIGRAVTEIDEAVLPDAANAKGEEVSTVAARLQSLVEEVKFLLGEMFQQAAGLEQGKDPLTRTLNRRFMATIMAREVATAAAARSVFSILMIDIDHFKSINDEYGHSGGDAVLRQVAECLLDSVRPSDFVFRYGGEEFLALLVEADADQAMTIAERIRSQVAEKAYRLPDRSEVRATVSLGLATYDGHPDYRFLVEIADQALYQAKKLGRDMVVRGQPGDGH